MLGLFRILLEIPVAPKTHPLRKALGAINNKSTFSIFGEGSQTCQDPVPPDLDWCGNPIENTRPFTVTLTGANCLVGGTLAMMLKNNSAIKKLKLYDQEDICGIAVDISHINTSVEVEAYSEYQNLPEAITDSDMIVICGGCQTDPCLTQQEVFEQNSGYVKSIATICAEFNPDAFVALVTEPVNYLVPMIHEEYLKAGRPYIGHKLAGVVNVNTMAANTILGTYSNADKSKVNCPIIGGNCPKTIVPLLSQVKRDLMGHKLEKVSKEIAYYAHKVLQMKLQDNAGSCYAINAFAAYKFLNSIINGLLETNADNKQYAFVKQFGKLERSVPFMTTLVQFGKTGIECISFPPLNETERKLLRDAVCHLRNQINAGQSFVSGKIFTTVVKKKSCKDTCRMYEGEKQNKAPPPKSKEKIIVEKGMSIVGLKQEDLTIHDAIIKDRVNPCDKSCEKEKSKCASGKIPW